MTPPSGLRLPKLITKVSKRGMMSKAIIHTNVGKASKVPWADLFSRSRWNMINPF